jgi:hypothetical protein
MMARKDSAETPTPKKKRAPNRTVQQIRDLWRISTEYQPRLPLYLLGVAVLVIGLAVLIAALLGQWWMGLVLGIMITLIIVVQIFSRVAQKAAYARIKGQQGATLAAMQSIRRGWNIEQEPVALNPRSQDMVFRATGRRGVALVAEGPSLQSAQTLLNKETKKTEKLLTNVPVHGIVVGDGKHQVPLEKVVSTMNAPKKVLTAKEADEVAKRLQALPNPIRSAIPKGVDPTRARPDRKAMRGK